VRHTKHSTKTCSLRQLSYMRLDARFVSSGSLPTASSSLLTRKLLPEDMYYLLLALSETILSRVHTKSARSFFTYW
jgi:hypothetical protein